MIENDPPPPFGRLDWSTFDQMQTALAPWMSQHLTTQEPAHLIAFVLYPGLTAFDLARRLEVLPRLRRNGAQLRPGVVGARAGPSLAGRRVRIVYQPHLS